MNDSTLDVLIQGFFAIIASVIGAVFTYILTRNKGENSNIPPTGPDGSPLDYLDDQDPVEAEAIAIPKLFAGFLLALAAAFVWGSGNAVTRYSAEPYPNSVAEIAFIHYFCGAISLIFIGFAIRSQSDAGKADNKVFQLKRVLLNPGLYLAAAFKSLNAYSWIFAVTLISAGLAATLENLHVIWTAIIIILFTGQRISGNWLWNAIVVFCGAALISNIGLNDTIESSTYVGSTFGWISSVTFSLFAIVWARFSLSELPFWHRCVEMAIFLLVSLLFFVPMHAAVQVLWVGADWTPKISLPAHHVLIQALVGVFSIAITYMLMNEALVIMKSAGSFAALILGLGVSFAVLFTMLVEFLIFHKSISIYQWMGVVLFSVGFAAVRNSIDRRR